MPESLTRRVYAGHISCGCPASRRNGVRLRLGTASGIVSESPSGIIRNLHKRDVEAQNAFKKTAFHAL